MKKDYQAPSVVEIALENQQGLLSGSIVSDKGIGYGGADGDGSHDPNTRQLDFDFEDDEN